MVNLYNESSSSCRQLSFDEMKGTQIHFPLPELCEMFMHRIRHRLMLNLQKAVSMEKIHPSLWCSFVSKQLRISEAEELTDPYRWQKTEHNDVIYLFTSPYIYIYPYILVSVFNNCDLIKLRIGEGYSGLLKLFNYHS
jgi:hypothetical protein